MDYQSKLEYIEKNYRLGNDMFNLAKQQDPGLTPLGRAFCKAFSDEFGIDVKHCHMLEVGGISVVIWYDGKCDLCKSETDKCLDDRYQQKAKKLFFDCIRQLGLPPFPEDVRLNFSMGKFFEAARGNYIWANIEYLNQRLRLEFPRANVTMFRVCYPPEYILLFTKPSDIPNNLTIAKMSGFIDSVCRENDKLGLFCGYRSTPRFSDFETEKPNLMGILIDNQWYHS